MHPSVARERATAHDDGRDVGVAIGPHPPEKLVRIVPIPRGEVVSWVLWEFAASIDGHVQIGRDYSRHPRILPHRDCRIRVKATRHIRGRHPGWSCWR